MKRFFAPMFVSIAILIAFEVETVSEPTVICTDVEFTTSSFEERILTRTYPSIFQAWNPVWVEGVPDEERSRDPKLAPFHDLVFNDFTPYDFPKLIRGYISEEQPYTTLSGKLVIDPEGIKERQQSYFSRNPNFIHLTHWNFFEADLRNNREFPADLKYWLLDAKGNRIPYDSHFYINFLDPNVQTYLIAYGVHLASCGVFDGIMVDNFTLDGAGVVNREATLATDEEVRAAIIHIFSEIRNRVRDDFLILVNAGPARESRLKSFTNLINGSFMECVREPHRAYNLDELKLIEETLLWNEENLRYPQINCLEGFGFPTEHPNSALNQKWMRIFTTLSLTHSNGYVLYNRGGFYIGEAHHDHYWYDFWDAELGRPVGEKAQLYKTPKGVSIEGLFIREFTNGWAVYNRSGKEQTIILPNQATGVTSGLRKRQHTVPDLDGEIYLKTVVQVAPGKHPPLYWIDAKTDTLQRIVDTEIKNIISGTQNARYLTVDAAGERLYWTEKTGNRTGKIQSANLDGTNVQLVKDLTSTPLDIALDATAGKLYLSNTWGKIQRMNLDGSDFQPNLVTGLEIPQNLVLDTATGQLYWTEQTSKTTGKIQRANLDGSNVQLVKVLTSAPRGMTLDVVNRKLYVTNAWGKLQRMSLDGSNFQPNFITGLVSPGQVAVDVIDGKLYWTEKGKLRRADLDGGNIQDVVIGLGELTDIALGIDFSGQTGVAAAPMTQTVVEQTSLLANYPNPFNPETWIPYHLANPSEVTISIYNVHGTLVRQLSLGHQHAGYYTDRSRAAYWDGRNAVGERVASGIYFYQFQADNVSLLRKMLILK